MQRTPRSLTERAQPLLEEAAERSRISARVRAARLVSAMRMIMQTTIAATVAWVIATEVVGHSEPFFAPIASIVTLGLTHGERGRRAVEIVLGVTLGIAVADLLLLGLDAGIWQLALVLVLAMGAALLLGSGHLFATQAAASACLVATIDPPVDGISFARSIDALIGGAVALLVSSLVWPVDPLRLIRRAGEPVLDELAAVLDDIAVALGRRDLTATQAALGRARAIDDAARELTEALDIGRETAYLLPRQRGSSDALAGYADAIGHIDLAVRNVRVLARAVRRALDLDEHVPEPMAEAIGDLADAVRELNASWRARSVSQALRLRRAEPVEQDLSRVDPRRDASIAAALKAARAATDVLDQTGNLSVSVIVGQVRSTALDLARTAGMSYEEAVTAIRR